MIPISCCSPLHSSDFYNCRHKNTVSTMETPPCIGWPSSRCLGSVSDLPGLPAPWLGFLETIQQNQEALPRSNHPQILSREGS